jgi:hypothetical protein
MIRTLIAITLNRGLIGEDHYVKCARCDTTASALEGAPLRTLSDIRITPISQRLATTPPEWTCPACGRSGPLEIGELLANDTVVHCRRRRICRHTWKVPAALTAMTCPRCYTVQPGPASPDNSRPSKKPKPGK